MVNVIACNRQTIVTRALTVCMYGLSFVIIANAAAAGTAASDTVYVNQYFEVRDGRPVKYVFAGIQRISRVTGSLDADVERVQRLTLTQGWNLVSIAVSSDHGMGNSGDVSNIYRFDKISGKWMEIDAMQSLNQADVLWVYAAAPSLIILKGKYTNNQLPDKQSGGIFLGSGRLQEVPVTVSTVSVSVWFFDNTAKKWLLQTGGKNAMFSDAPKTLGPGQAVFIQTAEPEKIISGEGFSNIVYYHKDHLGSSSLITDAKGDVSSEENFYPFGESRIKTGHLVVKPCYSFIDKERDDESGNFYVKARYYNPVLGRFLSVEPLIKNPVSFVGEPSSGHQYAYSRNNPLAYLDPDGRVEMTPGQRKKWTEMMQALEGGRRAVIHDRDEDGIIRGVTTVEKSTSGLEYKETNMTPGGENKLERTYNEKTKLLTEKSYNYEHSGPDRGDPEKFEKELEKEEANHFFPPDSPPSTSIEPKVTQFRAKTKAKTRKEEAVMMSSDDPSVRQAYVNQGVEGFDTGMESLPGSGMCSEE